MVVEIAALDLYTLFVEMIFGSFWFAVIGLVLVIFIIMLMGRMSIYTTMWYILMFIVAMTLGSGYVIINIMITLFLLVSVMWAWKGWVDRAGQ